MYGFKRVLLFVAASGLCVFAPSAFADTTTIFYDNFQSDGITLDGPAIGAGDIGGSWTIFEGGVAANVQVTDDPAYYVLMRDEGHGASAWATLNGSDAAATENQIVTLTGKIYKDTGASNLGIFFGDAAPSTGFNGELFDVAFHANGSITCWDGTTETTFDTVSFTTNDWQDVTLTANMATKTVTVAVAGHGSDTATWYSSNKIRAVAYFMDRNGASTYGALDDVRINLTTIPEPGTVVLMLSGVIGLLAYAWRKRK